MYTAGDLHRRNRSSRTRVSGKSGEWRRSALDNHSVHCASQELVEIQLTACSMSALVRPAGKVADFVQGFGTGITSEQSTMSSMLCPRTAIFRIAALKALCSLAWLSVTEWSIWHSGEYRTSMLYLLTKDCHSQAVRLSLARL